VVKCAKQFQSKIVLLQGVPAGGYLLDCGYPQFGAAAHSELAVIAQGPDEKEAVQGILGFLMTGAGI